MSTREWTLFSPTPVLNSRWDLIQSALFPSSMMRFRTSSSVRWSMRLSVCLVAHSPSSQWNARGVTNYSVNIARSKLLMPANKDVLMDAAPTVKLRVSSSRRSTLFCATVSTSASSLTDAFVATVKAKSFGRLSPTSKLIHNSTVLSTAATSVASISSNILTE